MLLIAIDYSSLEIINDPFGSDEPSIPVRPPPHSRFPLRCSLINDRLHDDVHVHSWTCGWLGSGQGPDHISGMGGKHCHGIRFSTSFFPNLFLSGLCFFLCNDIFHNIDYAFPGAICDKEILQMQFHPYTHTPPLLPSLFPVN